MNSTHPFGIYSGMPSGVIVVGLALAWLLLSLKTHESAFRAALPQLFRSLRSSRWHVALSLALAVGIGLMVLMPEVNVVFVAVDAAGLDLVTILIALELGHYVVMGYRLTLAPLLRIVYRLGPVPILEPYTDLLRGCPSLRAYVVIWPLFVTALTGTCLGGLIVEIARYSMRRI
jgi:hypothetical protein